VFVRNGIGVYANKFIEGLTLFSSAPIPQTATDGLARREDLDGLDCSWAYITNAFVTRAVSNTRLKVFEPEAMKTRDVPKLAAVPVGIAEHEAVQFSGEIPAFAPAGRSSSLQPRDG